MKHNRRQRKRASAGAWISRCYLVLLLATVATLVLINYRVLRTPFPAHSLPSTLPAPRILQQSNASSSPFDDAASSAGVRLKDSFEPLDDTATPLPRPNRDPETQPPEEVSPISERTPVPSPAPKTSERTPRRHRSSVKNQTRRDEIIAAARAERAKRRAAKDAARPPCPRHPRVNRTAERWRQLHFVHIPKAAGTALGQALRALVCEMNADRGAFAERNGLNCCLNRTKFCDLGGKCSTPGCSAIWNCELCECWHTPALKHLGKVPSITMIRNPVERAISGYLFRGHSPNWDRFNVRPEFSKHPGQGRRFSYDEYLDDMFEYHNPITRMIAHDSFPYTNISIVPADVTLAKARLKKFAFVGIQEAFEASVRLMLYKFKQSIPDKVWRSEVDKQRFAPPLEKRAPRQLAEIRKDGERLTAKSKKANFGDMEIYNWAVDQFCRRVSFVLLRLGASFHFHKLANNIRVPPLALVPKRLLCSLLCCCRDICDAKLMDRQTTKLCGPDRCVHEDGA